MAGLSQKTLAEVLRQYIAMESFVRAEPDHAIFQILEKLGMDPYEWARGVLEADEALEVCRRMYPAKPAAQSSNCLTIARKS